MALREIDPTELISDAEAERILERLNSAVRGDGTVDAEQMRLLADWHAHRAMRRQAQADRELRRAYWEMAFWVVAAVAFGIAMVWLWQR